MKESEKFADSTFFEGMTSLRAILTGNESGLNDRRILTVYFDRDATQKKSRELSFLRSKQKTMGFSLEYVSHEEIDERCIGTSHGGIAAECTGRTLDNSLPSDIRPSDFYVMLEGIEDPYNFGYALRSLYAFGVKAVFLPERNWMTAAGVVCRASAGASEMLQIYAGDCVETAMRMKALGCRVIATAKEHSVSIEKADVTSPVLLVVGGEKRGISRHLLSVCDAVVRIDYERGFCSSLSAASAAAVLAYEISRRNRG